jgi:hypothetical protein
MTVKNLSLFMAGLFAFGAIVQINDPDPILWMAIYIAASAACVLFYRGTLNPILPGVIAMVAVIWAADIGFDVFRRVPFLEMFQDWGMRDETVEESREVYGLLFIATWMSVLALLSARLGKRGAGQAGTTKKAASDRSAGRP